MIKVNGLKVSPKQAAQQALFEAVIGVCEGNYGSVDVSDVTPRESAKFDEQLKKISARIAKTCGRTTDAT